MIAGSLVGHATMFATPIWPPDETGKRSQAPPFLFTAKILMQRGIRKCFASFARLVRAIEDEREVRE
jgi:hypothetical protein